MGYCAFFADEAKLQAHTSTWLQELFDTADIWTVKYGMMLNTNKGVELQREWSESINRYKLSEAEIRTAESGHISKIES